MSDSTRKQSGNDPLQDILGTLLGGSQAEPASKPKPKPKPSSSKPKPSASKPKPKPSSTRPKPSASKPKPSAEQGGLDLGGLLQGFLGGGGQSQAGAGGLGGLESLLGGGQAGASSPLSPIVQSLAQKFGLPPAVAQIVVTFVLGKLMSGQQQGKGMDLGALLGGGVDRGQMESSGLAQELSQQTGLDIETSSKSLTAVFDMLGGR
jgi:hypothetical protein